MPSLTFITSDDAHHHCEGEVGTSAMRVAVENGVPGILAVCGGACSCSTCHVYVEPEWVERVGGPGATEGDLLDMADDRRSTSRLACQILLTPDLDGLTVRVGENSVDL